MQNTLFEPTKKHNTAETSIQSFIDYNRKGLRSKETVIIYAAISKNEPITSRELVRVTGLERGNVTRILFDMVNTADPIVKIAYDRPCIVTRKTVHHYATVEFEAKETGSV